MLLLESKGKSALRGRGEAYFCYIVHRPRIQLTLTAASYLSVGLSVQENFKHLWTQNAWPGLGLLPPAGPDHVLVAQLGGGRHLPRRHGGRGPVSPPFPSWGSEDKSSRGGELIFCRIEHLGPHTMAFQLLWQYYILVEQIIDFLINNWWNYQSLI